MKNLRYTFRKEFNSEHHLWVSLRWHHCDIIYKHYTWSHCLWKHLPRNSVSSFDFCGQKDSALMPFTLRCIQCMQTTVTWSIIHVWCEKFIAHGQESVNDQWPGHAASNQHSAANIVFSSSGNHEFVDRWDKCLNEYGRYVEQ